MRRIADIAQLTDEIKTLSDEIAAINAQQADATEIRNADKAKVAQEAAEKAAKVIQEQHRRGRTGSPEVHG